ncbi:sugar transferase, partial [Streptomyces halstedii]|nr:sugar transferase [Streptomyces halstedii]
MTTESAPMTRAAQAAPVRGTASVRPPRDGGGAEELPRARQGRAGRVFPVGLLAADAVAVGAGAVLVTHASPPWPV